jgi:hypothetical protein
VGAVEVALVDGRAALANHGTRFRRRRRAWTWMRAITLSVMSGYLREYQASRAAVSGAAPAVRALASVRWSP